MSTLDVQTLLNVQTLKSNTANTPPVIQDANGTQIGTLCRAWVNFNGSGTVAIRSAFNVSSITDGGVGTYTLNFTNSMSDANYAVTGTTHAGTNNSLPIRVTATQAGLATTSCRVKVCSGNQDEINSIGVLTDSNSVYVVIFA
jgi:hypothetical protein